MKKLLAGLAIVVVVVLVAAVAVPFLIPTETYKTQLSRQVENATGRDLTIAGDVSLSILPRTILTAEDVTFANAEWADDPDMAALDRIWIQVNPWALLSGAIEIETLVLERPTIHLAVNADGRANWDFAAAGEPGPREGDPSPEREPRPDAAPGDSPLGDLGLHDVRIEEGTVTYVDVQSNTAERLDDVTLSLSLETLDSPLGAEGSFAWNEDTIQITLLTGAPRGLMAGDPTRVQVDVEAPRAAVRFDGEVAQASDTRLDGQVDIRVPSVKDLVAWLGEPVEAGDDALEAFALSGVLAAEGDNFEFTAETLALDDIEGEGRLRVNLAGDKPHLDGRLDLAALDLTPYLPEPTETAPRDAEAGDATDAESPEDGEPAGEATTQWSEDPIDVSALHLVDADFELSVDSIRARDVEIGRSALAIALEGGVLRADLSELALYDGRGNGRVVVDARDAAPRIASRFSLEDVQAGPLLTDVADFDRLEGRGAIELDVEATGESQRAMAETLNGQGAISFQDGAIVGINIAEMVRNIGSAFRETGGPQRTDFAELAGTFTIENGLLRNDDLIMLNPLLRIRGQGTADIPDRTVDYRVTPRAVATLEGQGGSVEESGVAVPVLIQGSWDSPRFRPDLESLVRDAVRDPEAMRDQVRDTVRGIREGGGDGLGNVLEGLTGGGETDDEDDAAGDPVDTLRQMFGN